MQQSLDKILCLPAGSSKGDGDKASAWNYLEDDENIV